MSIYHQTRSQILDGISSAPGRVQSFLFNPEQHTTPHSCTRFKWNGKLDDLLTFTARALKGGSGVKITFGTETKLVEPRDLGDWNVYIDRFHPERAAIEKYGMMIYPYDKPSGFHNVFIIEDSIEGSNGILDSWSRLISLASWDNIVLDLSNIRPAGTQNSNGLIASGAESFLSIYLALATYLQTGTIDSLLKLLGVLNAVMRRGGYKKGIITSAMSSNCILIFDYLKVPIIEIEGSHKKGVILHESAFDNRELIDLIIESRNSESTFIEKPCDDGLAFNVCQGIVLSHKATCLIWRVNLGMCQISEIVEAFRQTAFNICELHTTWRGRCPELAAYYASIEDDRQVGLDVMGLANLLAIEEVTYLEFAKELYLLTLNPHPIPNCKAAEIAAAIIHGYQVAKLECDMYMLSKRLPLLDRIFTVEPAQSHAYETVDRVGKTTCRGIFPPTGRIVQRTSDSQENRRYFHGGVETDVMVGVKLHEQLCDLWQIVMNRTGRAHGVSQDSWSEMTVESLQEFQRRPSKTLYYAEAANFNQRGFLAKTVQKVDLTICDVDRKDECLSCAE